MKSILGMDSLHNFSLILWLKFSCLLCLKVTLSYATVAGGGGRSNIRDDIKKDPIRHVKTLQLGTKEGH